jgi:hypothetical protein
VIKEIDGVGQDDGRFLFPSECGGAPSEEQEEQEESMPKEL